MTFPKFQRTTRTRFAFFVVADTLLIAFSVVAAFFLRFEGSIPASYWSGAIQTTILLAVVFLLPLLYFFHLYWLSWAYVSTEELISLGKAVTLGFALLAGIVLFLRDTELFQEFPRSTLLMSYVFAFFSIGALRMAKRIYMQVVENQETENGKRTLIVGAGDAGEQLVRSLAAGRQNVRPVAFVDDNPIKKGVVIHGIKVVGTSNDIPRVVAQYQIEEMIIALPSAGAQAIKRAVEKGREAGLRNMRVVPTLQDIVRKGVPVDALREVQVEDLLGREPVHLHAELIERFIAGKTVLITGAAGSIGSELCRQVARFHPEALVLLDQDETGIFQMLHELRRSFPNLQVRPVVGNIQDKSRVEYVFENFRPQLVFHAAAYKHVPLMEENISEAVKNNIFGTLVVAKAADKYGAEKFVFVSTDKTVNPSSVMGATKRVGEMICQFENSRSDTKFISVRFGNVLNSRGSVIPLFRERIKRREALEVTHPEMKRYFMITSEACLLVMEAGAMGEGGEVFVLDMGQPVKIVDLAYEMIRLSGLEPDRDIPVVFVGPRPGEKLFEEVLSAEEGTMETQHAQIHKARLSSVNREMLEQGLEQLLSAVDSPQKEQCRLILQELVPTYTPQLWNKS